MVEENFLKFIRKNSHSHGKNPPLLFFFTDRHRFKDIFAVINSLPSGTAIIVREYDLHYEERMKFAKKIQSLARKKFLPMLIGKDLKLALEIKADGIHFSDHDISWMNYLRHKRIHRKNFLFTCSCHSIASLKKVDKLQLNAVFYSPIFPTKSHPDQTPIGILRLAKIAKESKVPLYALGGINNRNFKLLGRCKISGAAGIEFFINNYETYKAHK